MLEEAAEAVQQYLEWCAREYPKEQIETHLDAILSDIRDALQSVVIDLTAKQHGA